MITFAPPARMPARQQYQNKSFGEWVKRVRGGLSLRQAAAETGISHSRISDMEWGVVPSFRLLEQYCDGLKLARETRNEGFQLAGYEPVAPTDPDAAAEQLLEAVDHEELTYETEWEGITPDAYLGADDMTENDRRRVMAAMRRVLEADKRRRERGKG